MTPVVFNITANRHVPFLDDFQIAGFDLSEASGLLEVRLKRGSTGDALISLDVQTAGAEGLSITAAEVDGETISTVLIQIDDTTIDAVLPWPENGQKAGTDVQLHYDLILDGGDLGPIRWVEGQFTIHEGVSIP